MTPTPPSPHTPVSEKSSVSVQARFVGARDMRLRKHADYQQVYRAARKQFSSSMTWFLSPRTERLEANNESAPLPDAQTTIAGPRVGLTAGKVLGKAHERNRIKRRMREAIRRHIHELPDGVDLVLHPKRSVLTIDFMKLDAEVVRIFRQAAMQMRANLSAADGIRPSA